ncbi:MAG: endonuclease domain-containing protein [Gemmataceae bacterium]|nr:endonuclease domain-containing protein [Gemmataceae bacterium]
MGLRRFCGVSCSTKWKMEHTDLRSRIHRPEVWAKSGAGRSRFLRSDDPRAKEQIDRIRRLNPMENPDSVKKMADTIKRIGHRPPSRGGNGKGMTKPQKALLRLLGKPWLPEYAVPLGKRETGYPTNYKVDLALVVRKIAVEIDGSSHTGKRKEKDRKKDAKLALLGWTVLRFSNKAILNWIASGTPTDDPISTTFKSLGIRVTASAKS